MKYKIQYNVQVITREIDENGFPFPYMDTISQRAIINEDMPFEQQIKAAQILVEQVMRNLEKEHEKAKN